MTGVLIVEFVFVQMCAVRFEPGTLEREGASNPDIRRLTIHSRIKQHHRCTAGFVNILLE